MSRAIRVHAVGDASALKFETVEVPPPAAGEVQLRHTAIGVNFIDVYHRPGLYPPPLPKRSVASALMWKNSAS